MTEALKRLMGKADPEMNRKPQTSTAMIRCRGDEADATYHPTTSTGKRQLRGRDRMLSGGRRMK
jgi:hypothetical protein